MSDAKSSNDALMESARTVREQAHAPYSGYHVGAVVEDDTGAVHVGCNVENASFPEGICAETAAIAAMVAAGKRLIMRIAIVGGRADGALENCTPCGGCRQRIAEFANAGTEILLLGDDGHLLTLTIADLLPYSFSLK